MSALGTDAYRCANCRAVFFPFKQSKGVFCSPLCQRAFNRRRANLGQPRIVIEPVRVTSDELREMGR